MSLVKFIRKERNNFDKSHFERIYNSVHPSLKTSFNKQYRMHSSINNVIRQFYIKDNGLECGLDYTASNLQDVNNPSSRYHGINIPGVLNENHHVLWVNTSSAENIDPASRSRYNIGEIEVIDKLLALLTNNQSFQNYNKDLNNKEDKEIGIITFYGAQLKRMRSIKESYSELDLRISSVDRFQGMERNIVIISTVRSNRLATYDGQPIGETIKQSGLGFADSPNRLNVALSRAKRLVIIVGNSIHFTSESHGEKSLIYSNVLKEILNDTKGHCRFIDSTKLFDE
jgi:superfamily I DNA and/or RNA helicase